jgi:hypothetical protein
MNWNNIDLKEGSHERGALLIDPLTFNNLLLEIGCNVPEVTKESVKAQFFEDLNSRMEEARFVFEANLDNILKQAKEERSAP